MVRQRAVIAVVVATAFLTMLDNTVVTVAAPSIAADLDAPLPTLEWVATGYMLAFAGLMLPGGRLADRYGHRRALLVGLASFTGASAAAGAAGSAGLLIAARIGQGVGAALLVPATLAVVAAGGERGRLRGTAAWTVSGAVALAAGPVLGGAVSQHLHWSWIFLLNVPVGIAALGTAWYALDDGRDPGAAGLDVPGMCASTVALAAATYALTGGSVHGWTSPVVLGSAAVAAVAGAVFVAVERRAVTPMVDAGLFLVRAFRGGVAVQVLWGLGVNGVFFYTAIYLQDVRGYSPTQAGLAFLATAVAVAVGAPFAPRLVRGLGSARTVAVGLCLVAVGMGTVAAGSAHPVLLLLALTVIGFGSALTVPLGAVVLAAAPLRHAGVAGGVFAVAREVSGVLGIAGVGVVVTGASGFARGYVIGLCVAAALVLCGALIGALTLPGPGADADLSSAGGHPERGHDPGPGAVQLTLPVRPGVGAVEVEVRGGRDEV